MRSGERRAPGEPVELFDGAADPAPIDRPEEQVPTSPEPPSPPDGPVPVEK